MTFALVSPSVLPSLDESFRPAVLANRAFRAQVGSAGVPFVLGLERSEAEFSRYETVVFPEGHPGFDANLPYVERIVKFLLWQRGGHTLYVGGPRGIADRLNELYSANGAQKFDFHFMGDQVYEKTFRVISCAADEVPAARETGKSLGRHLAGYRIGFDLGASDRKVSAVVDGTPIYSEEVIWEPRKHSDREYHYS